MLLTFRRATATATASRRPARLLSTQPTTVPPSQNPTSTPPQPLTKPQLKTLILSQYHHGKFSNLFQTTISSPAVLLTAAHNLIHGGPNSPAPPTIDSISTNFFSISNMADELTQNRFDFDSCFVQLANDNDPISPESVPFNLNLNLPNLKLKVLIESIRMVLEVVYDDRFVTFSYGGRVGMGRHTAIRYLKNTVESPNWWFSVQFKKGKRFGSKNVDKLCSVIEEKVKDDRLIDVIRRLIRSKVVLIELGGCYLGRGFPQESGLDSILINVYLNVFDQKLQELRLLVNKENLKTRLDDGNDDQDHVFYKPLKVYVVRYLDEIVVITSGSKGLTVKLKDLVVRFFEKSLMLEVNREKTVIHSAVSEEIRFLGMDLRAVTPSVLRPPMSEKAIRARKKYLRQKEVRLQELKNRRETNRKKIAMKIFTHVYKKLKKSIGFKLDFEIEKEVREIFENWGRETVDEFLESVEERAAWYRKLSGGDFLSLKRIRDQLPLDLVESYDKFQEQVDKYLNPMKARKELVERRIKSEEEEEEKKYAERTVKDLTKLCIKVDAPDQLVREAVRLAGFTNNMGRPRPIGPLMVLEDADIIKWHAGVGKRWLDYFCCCHNFKIVKTVVNYHLRFSCILTLAEKHESTKREAIKHYTKDLRVFDVDGNEEVHFPTEREIKMMGDKNLADPRPVDGALTMVLTRLATDQDLYRCGAHFCQRFDTIVYRIRLLQKDLNLDHEKSWVLGMGVIPDVFHRKCVPLCPDHISQQYMGELTLQDIDFASLLNV